MLNVITGADKIALGTQLVEDPRVDVISFTGSTATGRRIMAAAAASVKRVFLELGGKSANILLDDADFGQALYGGLAVCYHAGQGCSIPTRMLVPRARVEEAVEALKTIFESLPYGDPDSREQILGPVISQAQRERVLGYVDYGEARGREARDRRRHPAAAAPRVLCRADPLCRRRQPHADRAGGNLRARARGDRARRRRRRSADRQ